MADGAPTRRSSRRPSPPGAPGAVASTGVLTRAELRRRAADSAPITDVVAEPSLAETVVADVAAAIMAESVGAQPDLSSRRRLRRAAHEVFASIADESAASESAFRAPESSPTFADSASADAQCRLDEFEFAARLFAFTGETPVQRPDGRTDAAPEPVSAASVDVATRRPRRTGAFQRVAAASFSLGVMTIVGMLAVGTTTPAAAVSAPAAATSDITAAAAPKATREIQAFVASGGSDVASLDRSESYNVASMADIAAQSGVTEFAGTWVNDPDADIQWPFEVGVPISAAFGSSSYLSQFSSPHRGVDLTPGLGAEIHVIAAGTVRIATEAGGDYGVTVVVDHIIDGQLVSTRYGHMLRGSLKVAVGDTVTAGEVIGNVGQTGKATGPHLHFEVLIGGTTQIDPIPWMYEHTSGTHTVG